MPKKKKRVVWNKKSGKFIKSSLMKPHSGEDNAPAQGAQNDEAQNSGKLKDFARSFSEQIRKAVRKNSDGKKS